MMERGQPAQSDKKSVEFGGVMREARMEARGVIRPGIIEPQGRSQRVAGPAAALKTITMVFEDRIAWAKRARDCGFSAEGAEAAAFWLLGRDEIELTFHELREAAPETEFRLLPIDRFLDDMTALRRGDRHLLWNMTDGQAGFRGSHVINFAMLSGLPYFGCPPYAQALGQDKFKLFSLCRQIGVRVPPSALVEDGEVMTSFLSDTDADDLFVKPNSGGNKVGL